MQTKQILAPMPATDTIAAIATAKGLGGIGVVRVSGPAAHKVGRQICSKQLQARSAVYCEFLAADQAVIDIGIAVYFAGPHSFTGEDVVELQGHGGAVVPDRVLARALELGARLAAPGEFSERAFLNNKIDLTQAESIAALVAADSAAAAKAAIRSLQGEFSRLIKRAIAGLIELRKYIEAAIDFPDEELELFSDGKIALNLQALQGELTQVLQQTTQGVLLTDGVKTVIAGKANAGKSSLLNLLAGEDAAIVTAIPGTTRDLLKTKILLDGIKLDLIDTAGLRETSDIIEQEGIRRALGAVATADLVLMLVDSCDPTSHPELLLQQLREQAALQTKFVVVYNKIDLLQNETAADQLAGVACVYISAKTGAGLERLKTVIKQQLGLTGELENVYSARRRHVVALEHALEHVRQACLGLQGGAGCELLAEELRLAQSELSAITGAFSADDLLGQIFSEFCIGK